MGALRDWLDRVMLHKGSVLAAWQLCSLDACAYTTACTGIVTIAGSSIPFFMASLAYTLLLVLSAWNVPKPKEGSKWYGYIAVTLLTIACDYTGISAYNMTSMSSAMLLCTTVSFWVAPISFFVFKRRYSIWQWLSLLLGIGGSVMIMIADGTEGNKWLGNLMALSSALCCAILTVTEEHLVHNDSTQLYLFRFALIATPLGWILTGAVNWKEMRDFPWEWRSGLLYVAYAVTLCLYYIISPYVMRFSDATTMNLSLLTANFYTLAVSILLFDQQPSWFYLIGFCCIPAAIALFTLTEKKEEPVEEKGEAVSDEPQEADLAVV